MIRVQDTLFHKRPDIYQDIEQKAYYQLQELHRNQRVQDDIFRILKNMPQIHLLTFPIEDENLCAFTLYKQKQFLYINSYLPLATQIFAAAHELYHVLYDGGQQERAQELLVDVEAFTEDENEMRANTFAACFLVPKHLLREEVSLLGIQSDGIRLTDVVKLMDAFSIPYKAMILRLHETGYLTLEQATKFLAVSDNNPQKGVMLLIQKTRHAIRWQKRTLEQEYSRFIELAVNCVQEHAIPFETVKSDFAILELEENVDTLFDEVKDIDN